MATLKKGINMLDLDLVLAILHHLFIFSLFAVLIAELAGVRRGMDATAVRRIQMIDNWYGALAALILIVGFSRAIFAAKGWAYYEHNAFFWAKITTFVVIGLLSIPPTVAFLRWRRENASPADSAVAKVVPYLWIQVALFPLLPAFAAAMARGYGEF
jgi:putative membrane protein